MTSPRSVAVVAGLLVVSLLPASAAAVQTPTQTAAGGTPTISASGTGEVTADPDQALVDVAVTATAASPSAATDRLANRTARLRAVLADAGLPEDAVLTTGFQLSERREEPETAFVARQSFELTVANTSDVGRIVDVAVAGGATEVFGVTFTLSPERRQDLRRTAIDRAVVDARAQADAVAASTDLTITGVRSVATGQGQVVPVFERFAVSETTIDPGPVTVTASVQITYEATAAADGPPANRTATPTPA